MDTIKAWEIKVAEWYENMPRLPAEGRKWLATNMWWIVLVGVILGSIGILSVITATFFAGAVLSIYGGAVGTAIGGLVLIASLAVIFFMVVTVTLGVIAIRPLKVMQRRGWTLLFVIMLVQVAEHIVSFLFNWSLFGLVWSLFFTAISGYFLFEIRELYGKTAMKPKVSLSVTVPKTDSK